MPGPIASSEFFVAKEPPQILRLEFEENDNVLSLLQQQFAEQGAKEYKVISAVGKVKRVRLNYFLGPQFKSKEFFGANVQRGSGVFKKNGLEFWGELKIVFPQGNTLQNGSAIELIADSGFTMEIQFVRV